MATISSLNPSGVTYPLSRGSNRPWSTNLTGKGAGRGADWYWAKSDGGAGGGERTAILSALRERVLERNYIKNLLEGIERELNA